MKHKALSLTLALFCNVMGAALTTNPAFAESPRIVLDPEILRDSGVNLEDHITPMPLFLRPDLVVQSKNPGAAPYPGQSYCDLHRGKTIVAFRIKNVGNKNAASTRATIAFSGHSAVRQIIVPPLSIGQSKTFHVKMPPGTHENTMVGFSIKADAHNAVVEHSENNKANAQCMMVVTAQGGNRS